MNDQQALERYRYMLRTAPPDDIERAHEEAFAALSPEQRRAVLNELSQRVPASEVGGDDPRSLARTATRAEMREPGMMERTFGGAGVPGLGLMFLSTLAGAFIGSSIAHAFFANEGSTAEGDAQAAESGSGDDADGSDPGGDAGDVDSGDVAGDTGDFGGGEFGGGDFGDFGGDIGF
jgi:hypothetical protein